MAHLRIILSVLLLLPILEESCASYINAQHLNKLESEKDSNALFLTPFIEKGSIQEARYLSKTRDLPNAPDLPSYSGLFTVNKTYNSNIFFWFFPAVNGDQNAPVLLWLQGGPGNPGLFGLFVEHGPYYLHANMTASIRKYHWAKTFQIIYVDQPVGTGFSFTDDEKGYVTNQEEMANDMYEFLRQFFIVYHEYRDNDFYITGESYGGKYVPSLAYKIYSMGSRSNINMKGIAVGNGMCDPETMMDYGPYLYNIGLVDRNQANVMQNLSNSIVEHIKKKEFYEALIGMDRLIIDFNVIPGISLFKNYTGFDFYYNFLTSEAPDDFEYYKSYIELPKFRQALHLGNLSFQNGKEAQKHLLLDIMQSVKSEVAVILDNYRVLFYSGQLDIIIPYPLTVNFLDTVQWKYAEESKLAQRSIWKLPDNKTIAGYVHNVKDFYKVVVRNAGHILPYDQPELAYDLITRFINGQPFA